MSEPEANVVAEARTCPNCGKPLRVDNTRGACSACWKEGYRPPEYSNGAAKPKRARKPKAKAEELPSSDVRDRFYAVANGLGLDAEEELSGLMEDWLNAAKKLVKGEVEEDDEADAE